MMNHLEFLGVPLGLVAAIALALMPGWRSASLTATVAAVMFMALWLMTVSTVKCSDEMCERGLVVWDAYRLAVIGFPAFVVFVVLALKLWALARAAKQRRRAEAYWAQ